MNGDISTTTQLMSWELFAGEAELTKQTVIGGHIAGQPADIREGVDFTKAEQRAQAIEHARVHKPTLVTVAFPCVPWSSLQPLNFAVGNFKALADRRVHEVFLEFARELALEQVKHGRLIVIEYP